MINSKVLGLIGLAMKAGKISFGADSVEQDIKKNKVKLILIANNASDRTKNRFEKLATDCNIPIIINQTIEELSKAIGKSNKAVIGVKDINFAKTIEEKYNGGDTIG